jgi:hypothetical protein
MPFLMNFLSLAGMPLKSFAPLNSLHRVVTTLLQKAQLALLRSRKAASRGHKVQADLLRTQNGILGDAKTILPPQSLVAAIL